MAEPLSTIAIIVANPALSSILSATLAASPRLRVRPFETQAALATYLRLAPVELVVADFDSEAARADLLAKELRQDRNLLTTDMQIIALASAVTAEVRAASVDAHIDEIVMKPMSPGYLLERVSARLLRRKRLQPAEASLRGRAIRDWSRFGDNIVPLFRQTPGPAH